MGIKNFGISPGGSNVHQSLRTTLMYTIFFSNGTIINNHSIQIPFHNFFHSLLVPKMEATLRKVPLTGIMPSEITQRKKEKCYMISLICGIFFKKLNFIDTENRLVVESEAGVKWVKVVKR